MSSPPFRRSQLAQQYDARERLKSVAAQEYTVRGRFFAEGIGEFKADVNFPCTYYEKPILFAGAVELEGEDIARYEHFPFAEVGVVGWKTRASADSGQLSRYYVGAYLAIRVTGATNQRAWVPYKFEGKALSSINVTETT